MKQSTNPYFCKSEDPFSTLEWSLRDVQIKDGTTGEVIYDSTVEAPVSWSDRGVQIVASRYLYGDDKDKIKEHSIKQLVHRVVRTITDWGLEDGYFATQEEADIFYCELAWLCVHQHGEFNSPTWFNCGLHHIYGVTSDKTKNFWTLDKKNNRIVQSRDLFESPQVSACQPYNAMVNTLNGQVPIGKIVENNMVDIEVYDRNGPTRVVAVKHNGKKKVLRIHTKSGHRLDVTPDHLIWRQFNGGDNGFFRADELCVGNRLRWVRSIENGENGGNTDKEIAEVKLAGWLQTDGYVGQYKKPKKQSLTIEAITMSDEEFNWVIDAIDLVWPGVHRLIIDVETKNKELYGRRIRMYGEVLRPFVEKWGLLQRGLDIEVPEILFTSSLDKIVAYLRSVYQAEGYATIQGSSAHIGFDVISPKLAYGVRRLLSRLGIFARVRIKKDKRENRHNLYSVDIGALGDRNLFNEKIGFVEGRKRERVICGLSMDCKAIHAFKTLKIQHIEELGEMDVYDIQTESGEYLCDNMLVHNCYILSVEDSMDSIMSLTTAEAMLFKFGSGCGTNSSTLRSSRERLTGGGTPSGPVSFMRIRDQVAGVIRSGGKTRRAAKLELLNIGHPDIEQFIEAKPSEERKAQALIGAGYSDGMDGDAYTSVMFQNSNFSVRMTDEFMRACDKNEEWSTRAVTTGEVVDTYDANELLSKIAEAAHFCGDPGVQFHDTFNKWNTCKASGEINATNPCLTGDTKVYVVEDGKVKLRRIDSVRDKNVNAISYDFEHKKVVVAKANNLGKTRQNAKVVKVRTAKGEIKLTPDHQVMTNRGWIRASELKKGDKVYRLKDFVLANNANNANKYPIREEQICAYSDEIEEVEVLDVEIVNDEDVYDWNIPRHHCFFTEEMLVSNCSEFCFLDNSACNLASLNLLRFVNEQGAFDVEKFQKAVDIFITAQDILIDRASYPTESIAANSHLFRPLGLGYTNLGALLMRFGMPYDSDIGRSFAAGVTSLMTARAYYTSSLLADKKGSFAEYEKNEVSMKEVMGLHRDANKRHINSAEKFGFDGIFKAADELWGKVVEAEKFRNAQTTLLAPAGTISFMMDADTTGIEPDFALVKTKTLSNGGTLSIVNRSVKAALRNLGYDDSQTKAIFEYLEANKSIVGAPGLKDEHLAVFDCAIGERAIDYWGHVNMMAAVQPFLSGSISKTINLPNDIESADIEDVYLQSWKSGLKSVAVFRDGCKVSPLSTGDIKRPEPKRYRLLDTCESIRHKFVIDDHEGYFMTGLYEDGSPGELFIKMSKQGSTIGGLMDAFSIAISIALQYGIPLKTLVDKFSYMRFEPSGWSKSSEVGFARSIVDYIFRWMSVRFLEKDNEAGDEDSLFGQELDDSKQSKQSKQNGQNKQAKQSKANKGADELCRSCGNLMQQSGTCFTCTVCGKTSGCS